MSTFLKILWIFFNWQRALVYHSAFFDPRPRDVYTPSDYGMSYEDVVLTTKDKVKLHCYFIPAKKARGTVILFHGNAMDQGGVLLYANELLRSNFNAFTLEYRGYGHNLGTPSEGGLARDGQAAVDYVLTHPELSKLPLIIYGQSLGGGVAIQTTYKNGDKIAALIIENTFTSIPDVVKKIPILRHIRFLCTQRWQSIDTIPKLPPTLPILMLSGLSDQVIPESHMRRLREAAQCRGRLEAKGKSLIEGLRLSKATKCEKQKEKEEGEEEPTADKKAQFRAFRRGTHNNTCYQPGYWGTVAHFLNDVLEPTS